MIIECAPLAGTNSLVANLERKARAALEKLKLEALQRAAAAVPFFWPVL